MDYFKSQFNVMVVVLTVERCLAMLPTVFDP
jgi:hypothetical protein